MPLGTPYRASAKSAARFSNTSWGQGRRQRTEGRPRVGVAVVQGARSYLFPPYPPSGHRPPSSLPRPFEYLGQPLGVSGVSGNNFLQPLESVVNSGLIQGWGKGRCLQDAPPRIAPTSKQSPSLDAEPLLRAQPRLASQRHPGKFPKVPGRRRAWEVRSPCSLRGGSYLSCSYQKDGVAAHQAREEYR